MTPISRMSLGVRSCPMEGGFAAAKANVITAQLVPVSRYQRAGYAATAAAIARITAPNHGDPDDQVARGISTSKATATVAATRGPPVIIATKPAVLPIVQTDTRLLSPNVVSTNPGRAIRAIARARISSRRPRFFPAIAGVNHTSLPVSRIRLRGVTGRRTQRARDPGWLLPDSCSPVAGVCGEFASCGCGEVSLGRIFRVFTGFSARLYA